MLCFRWTAKWFRCTHIHPFLDYFPICCCCCYQVTSVVSDSVQPQRRQPTRLPRPWGSPGKNTGVGCHFLLQCMKVKSESEVAQLSLTLHDPMDCSPPGSSVYGICQARILEWVPSPSPIRSGRTKSLRIPPGFCNESACQKEEREYGDWWLISIKAKCSQTLRKCKWNGRPSKRSQKRKWIEKGQD